MNGAASTITAHSAAAIIRVAGEDGVCDPRGALYFPAHRLLVVSDLHLEKGSALARRGMLAPPYDTTATLAALSVVIARHAPKTVISLGDSFHDGQGAAVLPDGARASLNSIMAGRNWFWIAGNHDPDPPAGLGGESVGDMSIGPLTFRHEPSSTVIEGEIAGHLHPCARIVQRGRSVRRRCFATDGGRLIMPAFGSYTGSLNVLDRAYSGLFRRDRLVAYMLGAGRVYAIAGAMLRPG